MKTQYPHFNAFVAPLGDINEAFLQEKELFDEILTADLPPHWDGSLLPVTLFEQPITKLTPEEKKLYAYYLQDLSDTRGHLAFMLVLLSLRVRKPDVEEAFLVRQGGEVLI